MSQYIKKTAIESIQRAIAFELKLSAENVEFHTDRGDYDKAKEYLVRRAGQVQLAKQVAQALHNTDHKFSKERFLSETFELAKIK